MSYICYPVCIFGIQQNCEENRIMLDLGWYKEDTYLGTTHIGTESWFCGISLYEAFGKAWLTKNFALGEFCPWAGMQKDLELQKFLSGLSRRRMWGVVFVFEEPPPLLIFFSPPPYIDCSGFTPDLKDLEQGLPNFLIQRPMNQRSLGKFTQGFLVP